MLHIIRSMTPRIFEWSNHTLSETLCKKIIEANNDDAYPMLSEASF